MLPNLFSSKTEHIFSFQVEYALSKGLRGAMVWSIDTDDFQGTCGGSTYPLLQSINYALASASNNSVEVTTTHPPEKVGKESEKPGKKQNDKENEINSSSAGAVGTTAQFAITMIPILASFWALLSNGLCW